jgi:acetylornithine/N-succinyldiaminopimelate aminotransferase
VCAGACSILGRINDELLKEVKEKSDYLVSAFTGAQGIESVSGMGLMLGLKTTRPAVEVVKDCIEKGVLCLTAKDRVRLLPALNIPLDLLQKAAYIIMEAAKS